VYWYEYLPTLVYESSAAMYRLNDQPMSPLYPVSVVFAPSEIEGSPVLKSEVLNLAWLFPSPNPR
jgi:hypothetical protein